MVLQAQCFNVFKLWQERCVEITHSVYLAPKVRYRYPGENWKEIIGATDYVLEESLGGQDENVRYRVSVSYETVHNSRNGSIKCGDIYGLVARNVYGAIIGLGISGGYVQVETVRNGETIYYLPTGPKAVFGIVEKGYNCTSRFNSSAAKTGSAKITAIVREDGQPDNSKSCVLKVFKNNNLIFEREEPLCPEVMLINCPSEEAVTNNYELESWEILFINDGSGVVGDIADTIGALIDATDIYPIAYGEIIDKIEDFIDGTPDECILIWKLSPIPPFAFLLNQFCSYPSCPAPEWSTECDINCKKETCPDGTCPIVCGDHVCCYNPLGESEKEIPLENYETGNSDSTTTIEDIVNSFNQNNDFPHPQQQG